MSLCKKCGMVGNIVLRKKDHYCAECFSTNTNHKFRACIGKNRVLSGNQNVLICLSGGPCSTVLLDLIYVGISLNNHKKLWITPIFFHLMGMTNEPDVEVLTAEALIKECNTYNYNVYIGHITQYLMKNDYVQECDTLPQVNNTFKSQFNDLMLSMSISSRNDFLTKVSRDLYIHFANLLQCKYIFTGETLGTLATNLLSNLTIGRGAQVQHDVGFCDNRNEVKILRPMKDISQEEIDQYIKLHQLTPIIRRDIQENCLQTVIQNFVTDLQENYQATISTISKTADKLGVGIKKCKTCKICESNIGENSNKLSALEATNYSRAVSAGRHTLPSESSSVYNKSEFLCYTCSNMVLEIDACKIPKHVQEVLKIHGDDD